MRVTVFPVLLILSAAIGAPPAYSEDLPKVSPALDWAYPRAAPGSLPETPPGVYHVPGGLRTFSQAQLNDEENPPDWFPEQHPPAPDSVAHAHRGGATACAECHLFNGMGFLGVPDLAGLPAAYITEQIEEFRSGRRRSAEHDRPAVQQMIEVATKVTDAELAAAAAYFAALPRTPWFRVVATDTVPVTRPNYYGWLDQVPHAGIEPIRHRIVELPEDFVRMMYLEDPHSGVVADVPRGAVMRGAALARSGGPGAQPCATCHGADLGGSGAVPPLAGRSAAYLARMLWDIKTGARQGPAIALMEPIAQGLTVGQITDIAAYLVSLKP